MKKRVISMLVLMMVVFGSANAFADESVCQGKVQEIQINSSGQIYALVDEGAKASYFFIGRVDWDGTRYQTQAMYSALLAAQMAEKEVKIVYPITVKCGSSNYSVPATKVKTTNVR